MEVDVLAGLFSRKQGQVVRQQLGGVVQHRPRIEPSFRDGHVIFDACRVDGKYKKKKEMNKNDIKENMSAP